MMRIKAGPLKESDVVILWLNLKGRDANFVAFYIEVHSKVVERKRFQGLEYQLLLLLLLLSHFSRV